MTDQNRLLLSGRIDDMPQFSHAVRGAAFYTFPIRVERLSGKDDVLPVIAAEHLLMPTLLPGDRICVSGQLRSFDRYDALGRHLHIFAYAKELSCTADPVDRNEILLTGALCRQPVYRRTPLGREIADLLLCSERAFQKRDHLPVIAWGTCAKRAAACQPADRMEVMGRFQSRPYEKRLADGNTEMRIAYEVSAFRIEPFQGE